jgi:hypothetical protein
VTSSEPIFDPKLGYREICSFQLANETLDGWITVSDEPPETTVRLTVFDPRTRP